MNEEKYWPEQSGNWICKIDKRRNANSEGTATAFLPHVHFKSTSSLYIQLVIHCPHYLLPYTKLLWGHRSIKLKHTQISQRKEKKKWLPNQKSKIIKYWTAYTNCMPTANDMDNAWEMPQTLSFSHQFFLFLRWKANQSCVDIVCLNVILW